ncbi:MAG: DNA replication and repair protein RecF [Ignavibacteria bacterium]|nr:DNA replication and repair protein RecF [Ignavibacteria bacterium]
MRIDKLSLLNFRNHIDTTLEFSPQINVLWGNNGVGKTSVLEAISMCSITKSFVPTADVSLINKDAKNFATTAYCTNELNTPYKISISYSVRERKLINSSIGNKLLPKEIIGEIPLVVLSPDNKCITNGSPEFRRNFVNGILSQSNKYYLDKLYEHRRILKQRNSVLQQLGKEMNPTQQLLLYLEQWTALFINTNAEIVLRRNEFINEFNPYFVDAYRIVSNSKEDVKLVYQPDSLSNADFSGIDAKDNIKNELQARATSLQSTEIRRMTTMFGMQKDDLKILLNGGIAREFASQGQHKSLLIALKFAEFRYLLAKKSETPIILFDDIFSELDKERVAKVINLLADSNAQIFITLTEPDILDVATNIIKKFIQITDKNTTEKCNEYNQ